MVGEICNEASNEAQNDAELTNIENAWKRTNFELG